MKKFLAAMVAVSVFAATAEDFVARFEPGLKGWTVKNMNNAVELKVDRYNGKNALVIPDCRARRGRRGKLPESLSP